MSASNRTVLVPSLHDRLSDANIGHGSTGLADEAPVIDPDAFAGDELTEREIDEMFVAEMERRDREAVRLPAEPSNYDAPRAAPEPPDRPRRLDRLDAMAEAEGVALQQLSAWLDRPLDDEQAYVYFGRLVSTAALYGREPLAPRAACRKRTAVNRSGKSRGWEPGDEVTRPADRAARTEMYESRRRAGVAALEQLPPTLTLKQAAAATGLSPNTLAHVVKAGRVPGTRVAEGNRRWTIIQRDDLISYIRTKRGGGPRTRP